MQWPSAAGHGCIQQVHEPRYKFCGRMCTGSCSGCGLAHGAKRWNSAICWWDKRSARVLLIPDTCCALNRMLWLMHVTTHRRTKAIIWLSFDVIELIMWVRAMLSVWNVMRWLASCWPHSSRAATIEFFESYWPIRPRCWPYATEPVLSQDAAIPLSPSGISVQM